MKLGIFNIYYMSSIMSIFFSEANVT